MANILAIDDEEGILEVIKVALSREGHRVTTICDFLSFPVERCLDYDLILLDVMMPHIYIMLLSCNNFTFSSIFIFSCCDD